MKKISKSDELHRVLAKLKKAGKKVGFVPTMGALHKGHLALIKKSIQENDVTVVSIFVNPIQFGPGEDFNRYPRPKAQDLSFLKKAKVDFVFTPSVSEMYPEGFSSLKPSFPLKGKLVSLSKILCGKFRPGHFQGVVEVVGRLFEIVGPDRAYFGAKDYQQCVVIRTLVDLYHFPIKISIQPTVREKDGLAMSSRNRYLLSEDRSRASEISKTLLGIRRVMRDKKLRISKVLGEARRHLLKTVDSIQYLSFCDAQTLKPLKHNRSRGLVLTACFVGKTRLIDNVIIPALSRGRS